MGPRPDPDSLSGTTEHTDPAGEADNADWADRLRRRVVPGALLACLATAVTLAIVQPIANAQEYQLAVALVLWLGVIWLLCILRSSLLTRGALLAFVLVAGIAIGVASLRSVDANSELVHTFDSVIQTVDQGENPYTSTAIYHRDANDQPKYGAFNYPPLELYPVLLAHQLAGRWDASVLTAEIVVLNLVACGVLAYALRRQARYFWPWIPLLALLEVRTNVSMTFLVVALLVWAITSAGPSPPPAKRVLIAVLFGIGLTAKFLVIPLAAAYLWHQFDRRRPGSLRPIIMQSAIAGITALAVVAPFDPVAVWRSTIAFNLDLNGRSQMTAFYPNVVSGLCKWLDVPGLYPLAAIVILGLAVLIAPRLDVWTAMLVAAYAFVVVATTPEPQYVPVILALGLATAYQRWEATAPTGTRASAVSEPATRLD